MNKSERCFSCSDCGLFHCDKQDTYYPDFCPTAQASVEEIEELRNIYKNTPEDYRIFQAAAEVEGCNYGKVTRVEEVIAFAKRISAKKVGVAACMGLLSEAALFTKAMRARGLDSYYCVACKVGAQDKSLFGISDELKIHPGCYEPACNPILQARILNREKTDLNVIIGLCVGHDSLFIKYSDALVTTLITKDRVLAHNPAAALYTCGSYYRGIMQAD